MVFFYMSEGPAIKLSEPADSKVDVHFSDSAV